MADVSFQLWQTAIREDILNYRDIEIEVVFDDNNKPKVNIGNLEFVGEARKLLDKWFKAGLTGGYGVFEMPPFGIIACNIRVLNGGVDLHNCSTEFTCDQINAPIKEVGSADFINETARSFSFSYLASGDKNVKAGAEITRSDFIQVPYVINSIPQYDQILIAGLSFFILIKELKGAIKDTASAIADLTGNANPLTLTALVAAIIKIILYITYIIFIIIALIDLLEMIFDNLIQPLKYKKGMRVIDLMEKACIQLGIKFSSSILRGDYIDLAIVPRKTSNITSSKITHSLFGALTGITYQTKDYDDANNATSAGYYEGTFADLIIALSDVFNAKATLVNGILYFERIDYFKKFAGYTLPNINYGMHSTNACELPSNYYLTFALDDIDANTYDSFEGTSCQHIATPNIQLFQKNLTPGGLVEKRVSFARAKMKTEFTAVETIFVEIYNIVDTIYGFVINFLNGIVGVINKFIKLVNAILKKSGIHIPVIPSFNAFPANPLYLRIGSMLLSSDFIGVPKLLLLDGSNHVSIDNDVKTSARYLIDNYHFINFILSNVDSNGNARNPNEHNQYYIFNDKDIPLCCSDFTHVLNSNYANTIDNRIAKIDSLIWNPSKETAKITFRIKEKYTNNIHETYIIDGK